MWIKRLKRAQDFNPGFAGLFINPFYFARKGLYNNVKDLSVHLSGEVVDVGCGRKPYRSLFKVGKYIGVDIENPGHDHSQEDIDVFYDGKSLPFENASFDHALCNQVLEHVFHPDEFLKEIHRVLRPEGRLLLTVPFAWDEHEQPYDYARYSSFGLKDLLQRNGFEILEHRKSVNDARAIFQLWNTYLYKQLLTRSGLVNLIIQLVFIAPFTLIGSIIWPVFGKSSDFFLDNVILAQKKP